MAIKDWKRQKNGWWNQKKLELLYIVHLSFDLPTSESYALKILRSREDSEIIEYKVSESQAKKSAMNYMRDN